MFSDFLTRLYSSLAKILFLMSSGGDARRRPSLWSYISFGSTPRRRSTSLPTRSNSGRDIHKIDSFTRNSGLDYKREGAWMTPGHRSRFWKTGGIIAFIFLVLYFLSGRSSAGVGGFVPGRLAQPKAYEAASEIFANPW